jgi:hypothetical protein
VERPVYFKAYRETRLFIRIETVGTSNKLKALNPFTERWRFIFSCVFDEMLDELLAWKIYMWVQ